MLKLAENGPGPARQRGRTNRIAYRPRVVVRTAALISIAGVAVATAASAPLAPTAAAAPVLGAWTELTASLPVPLGNTPSVLELPNGHAYDLWYGKAPGGQLSTYYVATLSPYGVAGTPESIFGTNYWGGLNWQPTLVAVGSAPLVIFQGDRRRERQGPIRGRVRRGGVRTNHPLGTADLVAD